MLIGVGLGLVLAIAVIAVVSVLTGGKVTNGKVLPTSNLVGEHIKSFSLPGLSGGTQTMPWTSGHATVLIFFASWCPPCRGEIPTLATYIRTHNLGAVHVVGIDANDPKDAAQAFVKKDGVTFPVAFDGSGTITAGTFGFGQLPETVFLNAKGVVKVVHLGATSKKEFVAGVKLLNKA
jgi:cytochrome c biogenesis protein CcmG/thiol:disulfide interchange protein DsbE